MLIFLYDSKVMAEKIKTVLLLAGIFLSFFVFISAENVSQIFNTQECTKNECVEKWVEFGREETYSIKLNY